MVCFVIISSDATLLIKMKCKIVDPIDFPLSSDKNYVIVFLYYPLYLNKLNAKYTKDKYQLNQFSYVNIKFGELLSEINNVLQK